MILPRPSNVGSSFGSSSLRWASSGAALRCAAALAVAGALAAAVRSVDAALLLHELAAAADAYNADRPLVTAALLAAAVGVWILSFIPLTPLELTIGYLLGVSSGYAVVFAGKLLGCTAAFLLGRTLAHGWARRRFGSHELLRALEHAVRARPLKVCVMVRIAYIPIAIKNYGLALLPVRTVDYAASLLLVEVVNSAVLVSIGSAAHNLGAILSGEAPKSAAEVGVMLLGCAFLVSLIAYLGGITRRALDDIRADGAEPRAAKANGRSNGHSNGVNGHNGHSKNGRSGHSNGHGNGHAAANGSSGHAAANGSSGHVATPPQPNGHQRRTRRSPARSSS